MKELVGEIFAIMKEVNTNNLLLPNCFINPFMALLVPTVSLKINLVRCNKSIKLA